MYTWICYWYTCGNADKEMNLPDIWTVYFEDGYIAHIEAKNGKRAKILAQQQRLSEGKNYKVKLIIKREWIKCKV